MVTDLWCVLATPRLYSVTLTFNNGWEYRNADCCINNDDDFSTSSKNFVNFTPVTPAISWFICMGGECTWAKIRCALVFRGHSLIGGSSIASL